MVLERKETKIRSYSIIDMILDPIKKKEADDEQQIFKEWREQRLKVNDESDWDCITKIFTAAIKKKKLTDNQINDLLDTIRSEVRNNN